MAWGAVAGAAISVVGGAMMSDGGAGQGQTQQASEADKAAAQISKEQWERYKQTYIPLEDQYVSEAQGAGSIANQNKSAQQSAADVASTFAGARQRLNQTPGGLSGQARMQKEADLNLAEAATSAATQNVARQNVVNQGRAARTDALSLGKGMPAQATNGLLSAANGMQAAGQYANSRGDAMAAGFGKAVGGLAPAIERWASSSGSYGAADPGFSGAGTPNYGGSSTNGNGAYTADTGVVYNNPSAF